MFTITITFTLPLLVCNATARAYPFMNMLIVHLPGIIATRASFYGTHNHYSHNYKLTHYPNLTALKRYNPFKTRETLINPEQLGWINVYAKDHASEDKNSTHLVITESIKNCLVYTTILAEFRTGTPTPRQILI